MSGTKWVGQNEGATWNRLYSWLSEHEQVDKVAVERAQVILGGRMKFMDSPGEVTILTGQTNLALTGDPCTKEDLERITSDRLV